MRWISSACAALVVILVAPTVRADEPGALSQGAADSLFSEAEKLMEAHEIARACTKFKESQKLDPQLGTLLHLADCYEQNGQTASAWTSFRTGMELAARKGDVRESVARERAAALSPKVIRLVFVIVPENDLSGLEVKLDGNLIERPLWGIPVPVDPGRHEVAFTAPGRYRWGQQLAPEPGSTTTIKAPPLTIEVGAPSEPMVERPKIDKMRLGGYTAGALGIAGVLTGVGFSISTAITSEGLDDICPSGIACTSNDISRYDEKYASAERSARAAQVFFTIGGALLVTGALMLFFASPSKAALR